MLAEALNPFQPAAVSPEVRPHLCLVRTARLLTLGLMAAFAFLMGHTPPLVEAEGRPTPSGESMSEAWSLAQNAQNLSDSRQIGAALSGWQRAYALSSDPTLLLEIARLERELGNFARATHAFDQFLQKGGARVSEQRRQLAARQMQASSLATARVNVQTNVLGAAVELEKDRGVATTTGFVVSLLLDAGERRLSFGKPGYETQSMVLALEPGEVRTLRIDLDKAAGGRSEGGSTKPRWASLD